MQTAVYRAFDVDGVLLYVGLSKYPARRFVQHSTEAAWWSDVRRLTIEWFPTRADAFEAEAAAIRAERPAHNVKGQLVPQESPTRCRDGAPMRVHSLRLSKADKAELKARGGGSLSAGVRAVIQEMMERERG